MKKLLRILTNKFVISAAVFAVWMLWFDQNDWQSQQERRKNLEATNNNIAYLEQEINKMEQEHRGLLTDPQKLEQLAREKYRMKKDNEDLYIIERK
jgi:cell division protein FtsB